MAPSSSSAPSSTGTAGSAGQDSVVGSVVRVSRGDVSVDVTIDQDNPAVRDLLTMLPLTLTLEEFSGREKIAYLPRDLNHQGSPGSQPRDGDLIYYVPWGNLGFFYNAAGSDYSDQVIHLGTFTASRDDLERLQGGAVAFELAG